MASKVTSLPKHVIANALSRNLDRARANFRTTLYDAFRDAVIEHGRATGAPQSRVDARLAAVQTMLARAEQTPEVTVILQGATIDQVNDAIREAAFKWWLHAMLAILDELPSILGDDAAKAQQTPKPEEVIFGDCWTELQPSILGDDNTEG